MNISEVAFILLLGGCSMSPYLSVGAAQQLDSKPRSWVNTEKRGWVRAAIGDQCGGPQAHIEAGFEFDWVKLGLHHQSYLFCGPPFNSLKEDSLNDFRITLEWGGK